MHLLPYVITSIFFGFSILNIALVIGRFHTKKSQLGKTYLDIADRIIVWTGMIFFLIVLIAEGFMFLLLMETKSNPIGGLKVTGVSHSSALFVYLLLMAISQLFRLNKIRRSNLFRFLISLIILAMVKFEDYVIMVTSLHRDFLPPSYSFLKDLFFKWGIELAVFWGVFFLVHLISEFRIKRGNSIKK